MHTRIPVLAVMSINGFSFGSSDRLLSTMILFGVNVPPSIPVASLDDDLDDLLAIGVDIDAALSVRRCSHSYISQNRITIQH
jgi:hypothetical protein